ncbi:CapA family protein [Oceanobacillus sp. FSL W8-0428]|uniref:PGA biosynthesis protein CapA n=1 Tax=Oceanobacillus sojae TaxID=582851 RepID=A0A511ZHD8_9BACI|nr:CapA family protein [Oceanobacillus sojae]GEN86860.1 PGA biosynthesis protein CapA [Oceanobacillus sojae]
MSKKLTYQEKILRMGKQQKKSAGKHVAIGLAAIVIFIIGHQIFFSPDVAEVEEKGDSEFTATFVGDIMFGRHVEDVTEKHGLTYPFEKVKPFFDNADYVSGNFENPILLQDEDNYEQIDKRIHLHTGEEAANALKELNFTMLNLANNHMMDYGAEGLNDTISALDNIGLNYVGAGENLEEATAIDYQEVNGLTIATLGYTDALVEGFSALGYRPGVARALPDNIFPMIEEANQNADLVFVNMHWGVEYDNQPHPRQTELARAMIDVGADAIIGHHSHVLQEVEKYKDGVIFYGLGNFVFDQGWSRTKDSAIVQYDLLSDGTGRFEITPLRINGAQPYVTENKYNQMKIHLQLMRNQPEENFKKEDGKLILEVDHSDVLEERGSDSEQ